MDFSLKDVNHGINSVRDRYKAAKISVGSGEDTKDLELAVAKATNHDETPPKEKHIRTLVQACEQGAPRSNIQVIIHRLEKRANNDHGWLVTLKCLISIHRLIRGTGLVFLEEMLQYSDHSGSNIARLENYKDVTAPDSWDHCSWIRVYSMYLDEVLDLHKNTKFDFMADKSAVAGRIRSLSTEELLELLPRLQRTQTKLTGCIPEGKAAATAPVLEAALLVVKESFGLYHAISEGVVCLVDRFFEMDRVKAHKAADVYRKSMYDTDKLSEYFKQVKSLEPISHAVKFPELTSPPPDFLSQMEDYARTAPIDGSPSSVTPNELRKSPGKTGSPALSQPQAKFGSPALPQYRKPQDGTRFSAPPAASAPAAVAEVEDLLSDLDVSAAKGPVGGFEDLGGDPFGNTSGHLFSPQPQSSFDGSFVSLSPDIKYPSGAPAVDLLSQPVADPFATAGISLLGQQLPAKQSFPVASDPFGFSTTTAGQAAPGHSPPTFSGFGVSQRDNPFAPAPHMQRVDPFPQPAGVPGLGAASGPPATAYAQPAVRLPQASNSRPVNPFQSSGIQPSMMTDRSKKSVHDPFAELSMIASKQGPGSGNQSAAMKRCDPAEDHELTTKTRVPTTSDMCLGIVQPMQSMGAKPLGNKETKPPQGAGPQGLYFGGPSLM